jgi:pimeloyl-ACP methyl ester carboxylesterase
LGQSKVQTEVEGSIGGAQFWAWKNGWQIHYTQSGQDGPPLLLLTGFGVGGFHYARNVEELSKNHKVWTMDVLGQGKSWPTTDPAPGGGFSEAGFQWGFGSASDADTNAASLDYSCSLWTSQAVEFLETVVRQVHYCYIKSMFHACLNRL